MVFTPQVGSRNCLDYTIANAKNFEMNAISQ